MFFKELNHSLYHLATSGTEDIFQIMEIPRRKHASIERIQKERLTDSEEEFGEIRSIQLSLFN